MAITARYVRVRSLTAYTQDFLDYTAAWTSCAELDLLDSGGTPLSRTGWTASADSANTSPTAYPASNVLDGSTSTLWHTQYSPSNTPQPHWIALDLGSPTPFSKVRYQNRDGFGGFNGCIGQYCIDVSVDGANWSQVDSGVWNTTAPPTASAYFSSNELLPVYAGSGAKPAINGLIYPAQAVVTGGGTYSIPNVIVPSGPNQMLVVSIGNRGLGTGADATTAVSWNGTSLTKLDAQVHTGVDQWASIWYLLNPTPATANVVITVSSQPSGADNAAFAYTLQDVDQTTPFGTPYINNAYGSGTPTVVANGAVIDVVVDGNQVGSLALTPGTGQALVGKQAIGYVGGPVIMGASFKTGSGSSISMSWTAINYAVWMVYPVKGAVTPINRLGLFDKDLRLKAWF